MRGAPTTRRAWLGALLLAGPVLASKRLRSGESRIKVTELWAHNAGQVPVQTDFAVRGDETYVFTAGEVGDVYSIPSSVELAAMPAAAVASIRPQVYNIGSLGMTSAKADPDFENFPYVYAFYTVQPSDYDKDTCDASGKGTTWIDGSKPYDDTTWCRSFGRLSRFRVTKDEFSFKKSEEVILIQDWCSSAQEHQTADILFLANGDMVVSAGDCSHSDAPDAGVGGAAALDDCVDSNAAAAAGLGKLQGVWRAQRDDSLCGKVVMIAQADYRRGGRPASAGTTSTLKTGTLDAGDVTVLAKGLRYPARMALHSSGDIYLSDQGVSQQEINRIPAVTADAEQPAEVVNFGWPCYEGSSSSKWASLLADLVKVDAQVSTTFCRDMADAVTAPAYSYTTKLDKEGSCKSGNGLVTGLAFYDDMQMPKQYQGALFVADANKDCLVYFPANAQGAPTFSSQPLLVFYESEKDNRPAMSDVRSANGALYIASPGYTTITKLGRGAVQPPVAAISLTDYTHDVDETITFDASPTTDPDATTKITKYTFDFGDGSPVNVLTQEAGPKVNHKYTETGIYKFTLTVENSQGFTDTFVMGLLIGVTFDFETTPSSGEWSVDAPLAYTMTAEGAELPEDSVVWKVMSKRCFYNECTDDEDCYEIEEKDYTKVGVAGTVTLPQDYDAPWSLVFYATVTGDSVGGLTVGPVRKEVKPLQYDITITRTGDFLIDSVVSKYSTRNNQQCTYAEPNCKLTVTAGSKLSIRAPLIQSNGGATIYEFVHWEVNGAARDNPTVEGLYSIFDEPAPDVEPEVDDDGNGMIVNAYYRAVQVTNAPSMLVSNTQPPVDLAIVQVVPGYGNLYVAFQSINRQTGKASEWPADFIIVTLSTDAEDLEYPHGIVVPQEWAWPVPKHQQDVTIQVPHGRQQWSVAIRAYNANDRLLSPAVRWEDDVFTASSGSRTSPCSNEAVCSAADGKAVCAEEGVLDAGDVANGYGLFYDANCIGDGRGYTDGCGAAGGANCRLCLLNRCMYQQLHQGEVLPRSIGNVPDCPPCVANSYKDVRLDNPITGAQRSFVDEINASEDPACECVGDDCYATLSPTPAPTAPSDTGSAFCDMPTDKVKCQYLASEGDIKNGVTLVYDPACLEGVGRLGCTYADGFGTRPECRYCIYDKCKYDANRGLAAGAANEFEYCGGADGLGADCIFGMGGLPFINKKQDYGCHSPAPSPGNDGTPAPTTMYTCSGGYLDDLCEEGSATLVAMDVSADAKWYIDGSRESAQVDYLNAVTLCPGEYSLRMGLPVFATEGASPDAFNWSLTLEGYTSAGASGHSLDSTSILVGGFADGLDDATCWADCRKKNFLCDACTTFAAMFGADSAPAEASPCDCEAKDGDAAIAKSACLDAGCDAEMHCGGVPKADFTIETGKKVVYRALIGSIDTNAAAMYAAEDLQSALASAAATWLGVDDKYVTLLAINGLNETEFAASDMSSLNDPAQKGYMRISVMTTAADAKNGARDTAGLASALAPNPGFANCAVVDVAAYSTTTYYVDSISDPRDDSGSENQKKQIGGMNVGAVVGIAIAGLVAAAIIACAISKAHKSHKAKKAAGLAAAPAAPAQS